MKNLKIDKINVFLQTLVICILVLTGSASGQMATNPKPKTSPTPTAKTDDYFGKLNSGDLDTLYKDLRDRDTERSAAKDLISKGDYNNAIKLLSKLIDKGFFDTEDMELRALVYYKQADYKKALSDIQMSIVSVDNGSSRQLTLRGDIYRKTFEFEKAMADYDLATKNDSKYSPAYDSRGYLYALRGKYEEALKDCTKAIALDKKNVSAYAHRGYIYAKKYRLAEARIDLRMALELDPKCDVASYNLTVLLSDDYDSEDGERVLNDEEFEASRKRHIYYV